MARVSLSPETYREKVYGGWLGKNVGGTLGGPLEGPMEKHDVDFYPDLPEDGGPMTNDDLDLQLVWLHAVTERGPHLEAADIAAEWAEHVYFPYDEYGYAVANVRTGLAPPLSGAHDNPFTDCMGSPIRSELWAMLAPGVPDAATRYAYEDALTDHAGGEGVDGEVFCAAIQSAAFVEDDPDVLLDVGLSYLPESSAVASAVRDVRRWHAAGHSWEETRERLIDAVGTVNITHAPLNLGFVVLGLLYGEDFGDAITTCVNCGWDTDSSGATLAALLGIVHGADGIPERWADPLGDRVVVSPEIQGLPEPGDLPELVDRTAAAARTVVDARDLPVAFEDGSAEVVADRADPARFPNDEATTRVEHRRVPADARGEDAGLALTVDRGDRGPAVEPGGETTVTLMARNRGPDAWTGRFGAEAPAGWTATGGQDVSLSPGETVTWSVDVSAPADAASPAAVAVTATRTYHGDTWTTERVPVTVLPASRWHVAGPDGERVEATPGSRLRLPDASPGTYTVRTTLHNPREGPVRLVVGTPHAATVRLDGEVVAEGDASPLRPSFVILGHLYPEIEAKNAHVDLDAGAHEVAIDLDVAEAGLDCRVVPTRGPADLESGLDRPMPLHRLTDARLDYEG